MADFEKLHALVEAAPDWEPEVDIHLSYRGAGDACQATWRAEVEAKEPVGVGLWQDPDADAKGEALAALLGALDRATLRHLIAKASEADAMRAVLAEMHAASLVVENMDPAGPDPNGAWVRMREADEAVDALAARCAGAA